MRDSGPEYDTPVEYGAVRLTETVYEPGVGLLLPHKIAPVPSASAVPLMTNVPLAVP